MNRFGFPGLRTQLAVITSGAPARAEFCWAYVQKASDAPIDCVRIGNPSLTCDWGSELSPDGNLCHARDATPGLTGLDDCCRTVPSSSTQSIELRHSLWHKCFGNTGNRRFAPNFPEHASNGHLNPPGRGAAWYAMHRQVLIDFDIEREANHDPRIEWVPQTTNHRLSHEYPSGVCADTPDAVWRRGNETGPNDGVPCQECIVYPSCLNHRPNDQPSNGNCSVTFPGIATITFKQDAGGRIAMCGANSAATAECRFTDDGTIATGTLTELTSIDQFTDVEQVTDLMDAYLHGQMHGAIGDAGLGRCSIPPYNTCTADGDCTTLGRCTNGACASNTAFKCNRLPTS